MRLSSFAQFSLIVLAFVLSCQSSPPPTLPAPVQTEFARQQTTPQGSAQASPRHLWGYYRCNADLEQGTVSVLPDRSVDMHINATKPLNNNLGIDISVDPSSTPATGYFVINVSITHPFPSNPSLAGFDVHGILLASGGIDAGGLRMSGAGDPQLLNADGWSRWWNPTEFTTPGVLGYVKGLYSIHGPAGPPSAMVNPYKIFCDGLWSTADISLLKVLQLNDPAGRTVFRSGKTNARQYKIQFPVSGGPKIYFDYAIDANWAKPTVDPPVNIPADFPIWANCMEPWLVEATVQECTLAGTPYGGASSGELKLSLDIWDWQGWSNGNYAGQIGNIRLYSPGIAFDTPAVSQQDGFHNTIVTVTATGMPSNIGTMPVLIEVCAPGTSWKQGAAEAPAGEIAAYARVSVDVGLMSCEGDDNVICDNAVWVDLVSSTKGAVCMPYDPSDYFAFAIPTGKVQEGTITLDNFDYGDNDLVLFDGCPGNPIGQATNPYGVTEILNVEDLEAGFYYIAVLTGETTGTDVQPYNLSLDIHESSTDCTTDDNNDYTSAVSIALQDTKTESVCAGGDIHDWYTITVPTDKVAGGTIYVDNAGVGNIDIRIYDTYPGPITFWGTNPDTMDELVTIGGLGPGVHYIEVFALGSTPDGDRGYTMDIDLISSEYSCSNNDGNDSYLTADPIGLTDAVSGTVCFPADPDWFTFIVPENKAADGGITLSSGMVADNDLYVYGDPAAAPIAYSAKVGVDDESVSLNDLAAGTYLIKAIAHPNVGNGDQPYTLTMSLTLKSVGDLDFKIHAHIIRKDDGSGPATTEANVNADVGWASQFFSEWGGSFTVAEISYINRTSWLAATSTEINQCHTIYKDTSGPINVYYVNSFPNMPNAAAFCRMDCRPTYQTHTSTYIAMSDYAEHGSLAHELGHATGIFHDVYLLDAGFTSCAQINAYYCPYGGANLSFCKESDAAYGNLMYFQISGWNDPSDYWLSDKNWETPAKPIESQAENWIYFHTNYPNSF